MSHSGKTAVAAMALLTFLLVISPGETARLPQFICDIYRDTFINLGCVDRENIFCGILNGLMVDTLFGRPACDYYPCRLYGRNVGVCRSPSNCLQSIGDGICNRGDVCCTQVRAPGSSSSESSSSDEDFAPLTRTNFNLGHFAVDALPRDFQDNNRDGNGKK